MKVYNFLYKYQYFLLGFGFFIILFSVAFKFSNSSIELIWKNEPLIAITIMAIGLILVLGYIQLDKLKLKKLSKAINEHEANLGNDQPELLDQLTRRQKEVFDLILSGKSNKEIMSILYIEASTLKTHINHIYKKLNIKSRNELRKLNHNRPSQD